MRVFFLAVFMNCLCVCLGQVSFNATSNAVNQLVQLDDGSYASIGTQVNDVAGLVFRCNITRFSSAGEAMPGTGYGGYVSIQGYGYAITKTADGGFAVLCKRLIHDNYYPDANLKWQVVLAKFNSNTVLQWQKGFNLPSFNLRNVTNWDGAKLLQLKDHSFLIAINVNKGDSTDFGCLIKTDSAGNLITAQQLGGIRNSIGYYPFNDAFRTLTRSFNISDVTEDQEGYTCLVSTHSYAKDSSSADTAWLIKLNRSNQIVWTKYVQPATGDAVNVRANSVMTAPDGSGYVLTGSVQRRPDSLATNPAYRWRCFVMKMETQGNVVWSKASDTATGDNLDFVSAKAAPDGGYMCGGALYTSRIVPDTTLQCAYIMKLDTGGHQQWARGIDELQFISLPPGGELRYAFMGVTDAIPTSDSGYCLAGYYYSGTFHMNYAYTKKIYKLNSALQVCSRNWAYRSPLTDMVFATSPGIMPISTFSGIQPATDTVFFSEGSFFTANCVDSSVVVPFQFLSVTATLQNNNKTIVEWKASGEGNTDHFVVQRSDSTLQFTNWQQVKASANNNDTLTYSVTDDSTFLPGTLYYRVQEIDREDNITNSQVVSVTVLPFQLMYFTTILSPDTTVAVAWQAQYENNLSSYTLQRADSTSIFTTLYTIKAWNTGIPATYQFTDIHPLPGTSYYRLQEVHTDGTSTYSFADSVIIVPGQPIADSSHLVANIAPNLVTDMVRMNIQSKTTGNVRIRINDLSGRTVAEQKAMVAKGMNIITIPVTSLQKGMFIVKIVNSDGITLSLKFVKQ